MARADGHPLTALVVDDNEVTRKLISALMRRLGYQVADARDGVEAVSAVAASDFDCVLMDIDMPRMTGLEATRVIRAMPGKAGRVPIIAITARTRPEEVDECRDAGMDGHLGKPVAVTDLDKTLTQALHQR